MATNKIEDLIKKVFTRGYINDGYGGGYYKPSAVLAVLVITVNDADKVCVVPKYFDTVFAVREFYVNDKDGFVHLKREDCAPAIWTDRYHRTLEAAIELHNQTYGMNMRLIKKRDT